MGSRVPAWSHAAKKVLKRDQRLKSSNHFWGHFSNILASWGVSFFRCFLGYPFRGHFGNFSAQRPPKRVLLGAVFVTFLEPAEKVKIDVLCRRELRFGGRRGPDSRHFSRPFSRTVPRPKPGRNFCRCRRFWVPFGDPLGDLFGTFGRLLGGFIF